MKPWQHGYDIDFLKGIEKEYGHYNSFTLSPFAQFKKNNIAEGLHKGTLQQLNEETFVNVSTAKSPSDITMHGDTVIARKTKGDITIRNMTGDFPVLETFLNDKKEDNTVFGTVKNNIWLYVWAEEILTNAIAKSCGFDLVGPKITTFGEMYNIYYYGSPREFPELDKAEYESIKKIGDVDLSIIESISNKIDTLPAFTNHYSNYNKDKSWSALSLRGYTDDPSFITKPIEMSKKWKEEHKNEKFELQDTPLYEHFPEIRDLIKPYGNDVHRVRFMQLKPGGGELERHTDQVDPDSGGSLSKLARLHFPIQTNAQMTFNVWHTDGDCRVRHMKIGECWFLDTRKPHRAINEGTTNRTHLVVDLITEKCLNELIIG